MRRGRHVAPKGRAGRISWGALGLVLGLVLAMAMPVGAASWEEKVNGGSSYASPYGEFTVTLSAFDRGDGVYTGEGQYHFAPLDRTFHLKVEKVCFGSYDGDLTAVGVGEVFGQDDTTVSEGYGGIAVRDGDTDYFRVMFDESWATVDTWCTTQATSSHWPAAVVDGNFNIKAK